MGKPVRLLPGTAARIKKSETLLPGKVERNPGRTMDKPKRDWRIGFLRDLEEKHHQQRLRDLAIGYEHLREHLASVQLANEEHYKRQLQILDEAKKGSDIIETVKKMNIGNSGLEEFTMGKLISEFGKTLDGHITSKGGKHGAAQRPRSKGRH